MRTARPSASRGASSTSTAASSAARAGVAKMLNLLRAGGADDYQTEALLRQGDRPF